MWTKVYKPIQALKKSKNHDEQVTGHKAVVWHWQADDRTELAYERDCPRIEVSHFNVLTKTTKHKKKKFAILLKSSEIHEFPLNTGVRDRSPGTTTPEATPNSEPDVGLLRLHDGSQIEVEGDQDRMEPRFKTRNVIDFFK